MKLGTTAMEPKLGGRDRHVPAEVCGEILSRLPVKSLMRFRCVSKPWLAFVDDDAQFARSHLNNYLKNNRDEPRLFVHQMPPNARSDGEFVVRPSDTFEPVSETLYAPCSSYEPWDHCYCRAVSSLHGLVLLKHYPKADGQFGDLELWNPSIRKMRQVPPLVIRTIVTLPEKDQDYEYDIVTDRDIGLGYDLVAQRYKHVKLILVDREDALHSIAIYTLGDDSWHTISLSSWHWDVHEFYNAVYFEGSLYFMCLDLEKDEYWDLVRFDLSKEVFSSAEVGVGARMPNWGAPKLVSFDAGVPSVVAFDHYHLNWYMWALDSESMCWTKPHEYALHDHYLSHVKKNGDVLSFRESGHKISPTRFSMLNLFHDTWEEDDSVTSINHETGERNTMYPPIHFVHVSCYVESLILHSL